MHLTTLSFVNARALNEAGENENKGKRTCAGGDATDSVIFIMYTVYYDTSGHVVYGK